MKIREEGKTFYIYDLMPIIFILCVYLLSDYSNNRKFSICDVTFILYFVTRQLTLSFLYDENGKIIKHKKKWRK